MDTSSSEGSGGNAGGADGAIGRGRSDHLTILSGTGQNIFGLGVFVVATFGMSILIARTFGKHSAAFGQITLATQLAFVAGAATRFGMDMASTRRVAIEIGRGESGRVRSVVRISAGIALAVSVAIGAVVALLAGPIASFLKASTDAYRAAAFALVFVAVAQVYMAASRGLKIMRHTLYGYWIGQSLSWIALTLVGWRLVGKTVPVTVFCYALSWVVATAISIVSWGSATRGLGTLPAEPGEPRALLRYGAPRAPAALLSQAVFYTDLAVLSHHLPSGDPDVSVYAASIRVAQALVLFLTAVSYMFSPFVADMHERGERDKLNDLFKLVTRLSLAGTIPILLVLAVAPGSVLRMFGDSYGSGTQWLRILLIGQIVNVSVGAAGFVLIMVGRTGWDLLVYASSFLLDLIVALLLVPHFGATGAAIAQATMLVFSNAFRLTLVWRFARIQPYNRYYLLLAIPAAAGAVVMIAVHHALAGPKWGIDILGTAFAGTVVYGVVLLFTALDPKEKAAVWRLLGRAPTRPGP